MHPGVLRKTSNTSTTCPKNICNCGTQTHDATEQIIEIIEKSSIEKLVCTFFGVNRLQLKPCTVFFSLARPHSIYRYCYSNIIIQRYQVMNQNAKLRLQDKTNTESAQLHLAMFAQLLYKFACNTQLKKLNVIIFVVKTCLSLQFNMHNCESIQRLCLFVSQIFF